MTARRLTQQEIDAILRQRRAEAYARLPQRGHRALPLAVSEQLAQETRTAWPNTCPGCNVGTHGACDCPTQGASAVSGIESEPGYRPLRSRPAPPRMPWRDLAAGLLVLLVTVCCVHVISGAPYPLGTASKVAKR